ncbi:MAG: radical SAM protein [Clostridiales bacterium]|nr:radical SAM protein [Clostridiales bacterium]
MDPISSPAKNNRNGQPEIPLAERLRPRQRRRSLKRSLIGFAAWAAPRVGKKTPVLRMFANSWEQKMRQGTEADIRAGMRPPGVLRDRVDVGVAILRTLERALAEDRLSRSTARRLLNVLIGDGMVSHGIYDGKVRFKEQFAVRPPGFILISPTKTCNLRCEGCYADSGPSREKLEWEIIDRMVRECYELWGAPFIVISGGEPLAYEDQGKGILDMAGKHPECYFMMYTNGTLVDDKTARRLAELGNLTPAVSVEGLREKTERRRGEGVFDRVVAAMERLRLRKVFFGISLTATRDNADEVLSDEVVDFYFDRMGAMYAWIFHYMPIGRSYTLDLLPTPGQRLRMWQRAWELIRRRHLFIADFWNLGTASFGCVAAGHEGGYMTVDWNGNISPCVFIPYSPLNIHDVYAQGKSLNDVWAHPFFERLRAWQDRYSNEKNYTKGGWHGNWLMPCPNRDHHAEFYDILKESNVRPIDEPAEAALHDADYHKGLEAYDKAVAELFDPIWKEQYLKPGH